MDGVHRRLGEEGLGPPDVREVRLQIGRRLRAVQIRHPAREVDALADGGVGLQTQPVSQLGLAHQNQDQRARRVHRLVQQLSRIPDNS